ncbi:MAG: MFS transporter [Pseudomonadota bacterium]
MTDILGQMLRLEKGEWPKLVQFGMLGFLMQMGLGIGFSAGDAAFFSNVGAAQLPVIFLLTPVVMLVYTSAYSFLLMRSSIDRVVDLALAGLTVGGIALWALLDADLPPEIRTASYFALKLYLVMWYFALYTLFWSYTDTYFHIQDAKRLFPLFAAFCALGTASGALLVHLLADLLPMHYFLLLWSAVAVSTMPLVRMLRKRWSQIQESELELTFERNEKQSKLSMVFDAFRTSKYTRIYAFALFVMLIMTNLIEYQYATTLAASRSEVELAELFGALYAAVNVFNLFICLFVFNRLVSRFGVRNVAFILPLTYFVAFGFLFLQGSEIAAIAAFFSYHGILTSIEYNNENLLFNAVPSTVKKPLRAVIEGMCEPLASLLAGGFLIYAAHYLTPRELSGIGIVIGVGLVVVVVLLRHHYPTAMAENMRRGSLHFGNQRLRSPCFSAEAREMLEAEAGDDASPHSELAQSLLGDDSTPALTSRHKNLDQLSDALDSKDPAERREALYALCEIAKPEDIHLAPAIISKLSYLDRSARRIAIILIGRIGDTETIQDILAASGALAGRERRAIASMLVNLGETAIPRLISVLCDRHYGHQTRSLAARALADLSYAQLTAQIDRLVKEELAQAHRLRGNAERLENVQSGSDAMAILSQAQHERVARAVDFVLELLALDGKLPNFDLLIVSLHSTNPKVRANAFEAIENSVDYDTYRSIVALLHKREQTTPADAVQHSDDVMPLIENTLEFGYEMETAAAMQILHEHLPTDHFLQKIRSVIKPDMPAATRRQLLKLLGLRHENEASPTALVASLRRMTPFSAAPLTALSDLARLAEFTAPGASSIKGEADGASFWITHKNIREVASRRAELALLILREWDERHAAA